MIVTSLGWVIFPLGIVALFTPGELLLYLTILFSGFTGSSVFLVSGFSVQPSYYLAILWLLQCFYRDGFKPKFMSNRVLLPFYCFLGIAIISLIMPLAFEGRVTIMNVDGEIEKLSFSSSNITQLIYLLFVSIFFVTLSRLISENGRLAETVRKTYIYGVILVCFVCFYQMVAYRFNLPFDSFFKTGLVRSNLTAYREKLMYEGRRISGPCLEASMLAYYLVAALPLCFRSRSSLIRIIMPIVIVFLGVITKSSTFLVGFVGWVVIEFLSILKKDSSQKKTITVGYVFFLLTLLLIVIALSVNLIDIVGENISELVSSLGSKLRRENQSGQERSESFWLLLEAFKESPIIGLGFGSTRGKDLLSTWLANIGCLGLFSFFIFLYLLIKKSQNSSKRQYHIAVFLVWSCMFMSVPEPYNFFIWILMSLSF